MADVEKLIKAGGTLGLSGQDLNDWVTTRLAEHEKHRQEDLERLKMEKEKIWEKQQVVEKELELEKLRLENQSESPCQGGYHWGKYYQGSESILL